MSLERERSARTTRRRRRWWPLLGLLALACRSPQPALPEPAPPAPAPLARPLPGAVQAQLLPGEGSWDPGTAVVYLDPLGPVAATAAAAAATIEQRDGRFSPALLVVSRGQPIRFADAAGVLHRFFSYAEGNAFELGVAPADSPQLSLEQPGPVRFYCSLHPWESGTIFVSPTPLFAVGLAEEDHRIGSVPPGRYRLRVWGPALRGDDREITVRPGEVASFEIPIQRDGAGGE